MSRGLSSVEVSRTVHAPEVSVTQRWLVEPLAVPRADYSSTGESPRAEAVAE